MKNADYVYISYSRKDIAFVNALVEKLKLAKIKYWRDVENLKTDDDIESSIKKNVLGAAVLVYVSSKNAVQSAGMRNELNIFLNQKKGIVVPVIIDREGELNIVEKLSNISPIDFRQNFNEAIDSLLTVLSEQLNRSSGFSWFSRIGKEQKNKNEPKLLASFEYVITIPDQTKDEIFGLEEYIWEHETQWRKEIIEDVNKQLQLKYGNSVYAKIEHTRRGSIIVTLGIILAALTTGYSFVAQYKDFFDSTKLLQKQINSIINKVTRRIIREKTGSPTSSIPLKIEPKSARVYPETRVRTKSFWQNLISNNTNLYWLGINFLLVIALLIIIWRLLDILSMSLSTPKNIYIYKESSQTETTTPTSANSTLLTPTIEPIDAQSLDFTYLNMNVNPTGDVILRTVINTISNGNRRPTSVLQSNNFSITETYQNEKRNAGVLQAIPIEIPLEIIMLVDTSGSMKDLTTIKDESGRPLTELEVIKKAIILFVNDMTADGISTTNSIPSRIAILPFASDGYGFLKRNDGEIWFPMMPENRLEIQGEIETLSIGQDTRLYDAIADALSVSQKSDNTRYKLIFCLTDGHDTASKNGAYSSLLDKLISSPISIPVITAGFGVANEIDKNILEEISINSNAESYTNLAPQDLSNIFKQLSLDIKTVYEIRWKSSFPNSGNKVDYTITVNFPSLSSEFPPPTLSDSYTIPTVSK